MRELLMPIDTRALLGCAVMAASPIVANAQRLGPRDVDTLPSRPAQFRGAYGSDSL